MPSYRLRIDGNTFRDHHDRQITLHGINVSGDSKYPAHPDVPSHVKEQFYDDNASFVDRPFPLEDAHVHFARLKSCGYNCIRYIFTWEAIEHAGPGKYDEDFIQHTIKTLRVAQQYGFYVFMDPHQDVWSRFTGGSGSPLWTVYAAGLDPKKLQKTQAALVQNTWPDPSKFPKMVWASNYTRLAVQTLFTLFFTGKSFAPKCVIDGKNIQDYLQDHFIAACAHLAKRIVEAGDLCGETVLGFETMNEPSLGYAGHPDLSKIPDAQNLRSKTTPTGWQAMLTGSGRAVEVDTWEFGGMGPYKSGTELVDPEGEAVWLDPSSWDDGKYGWKRSPSWELGKCIWAQHGVWDQENDELQKPHYFASDPSTGEDVNIEYWTNHYFVEHYRKYRKAIRDMWPESIMFMQSAVFEIPPTIKGTELDEPNMVFASHFYDGITLITKKWNRLYNVDVLGILRGRYLTPAFGVKIGETAIRNCFRDQLAGLRKEGEEHLGVHPTMFTEIGIPYDMDEKAAYNTGNYSSQIAAIDANNFALEGSGVAGFTWWVYTADNNHYWGDNWNGEDLSIYSRDDYPAPTPNTALTTTYSNASSTASLPPKVQRMHMSVAPPSPSSSSLPTDTPIGYRAAEAYIRPHPIYTAGTLTTHSFDLKSATFTLSLRPNAKASQQYTEIFLPTLHFPTSAISVLATSGKWEVLAVPMLSKLDSASTSSSSSGRTSATANAGASSDEDTSTIQILRWQLPPNASQEESITIHGIKRKDGKLPLPGRDGQVEEDEEEGWMDFYWNFGKSCRVM